MKKLLSTLLAALAVALALAPPGAAQIGGLAGLQHASGKLYLRADGSDLRAVVEIDVEPGWYLYHSELGGPEAVGKPTTLEWDGIQAAWSEPGFPDPKRKDIDWDADAWTWVHYGTMRLYARGTLAPDGDVDAVSVTVDGLTCSDETGTCVPYREELESEGAGDDALFAAFPADLVAPRLAGDGGDGPSAEFEPTFDGGRRADARLFVRFEEDVATAVVQIGVEDGWHLYHGPTQGDLGPPNVVGKPTTIELDGVDADWGAPVFPKPHPYPQDTDGDGIPDADINSHEGVFTVRLEGFLLDTEASPEDVTATVRGLTCDVGGCVPYTQELESLGAGPDSLFGVGSSGVDGAGSSDGAAEDAGDEEKEGEGLFAFLVGAFLAGLITLLMPCTYPMIPITISFFTKQATSREGSVMPLSIAYGAGIVAIFVMIGAVVGPAIVPFATHPVTNIIIGVVFVYFALVLFGAINLQPPQALMRVAAKANQKGGFLGVFLMGAALVVTSFTCTAPFVGSLLAAGADGGLTRIVLGMGVFGLTMAVPFVILSMLPGRMKAMPQAGEWMNTLKVFLGFVELAAALKFISNADIGWHWGILSRELFLILWVVLLGLGGLYLLKKAFAPDGFHKRVLVASLATFGIVAYLGSGLRGRQMDDITTALLPNYQSAALTDLLGGRYWSDRHEIVVDDLEAAIVAAKDQDKMVLVNFTGHT